jgi:RNA-directed DNA polymerase
MRGRVERTGVEVREILEGLELRVNEEKTQVLDARQRSFAFLGFSFRRKRSTRTGRLIALVQPSKKAEQRFR